MTKGAKHMEVTARINRQRKTLVVEIPLRRATPSASGKTLVVATTQGCKTTNVRHRGRPVVVVASAFVYPEKNPRKNPEPE
jgi:hypothetical protein